MKATKANGTPIARRWPVEGPNKVVIRAEGVFLRMPLHRCTREFHGQFAAEKAQAECDRLNLQWRADRMANIARYANKRWYLSVCESEMFYFWEIIYDQSSNSSMKLDTQLYTQHYNLTNTTK